MPVLSEFLIIDPRPNSSAMRRVKSTGSRMYHIVALHLYPLSSCAPCFFAASRIESEQFLSPVSVSGDRSSSPQDLFIMSKSLGDSGMPRPEELIELLYIVEDS